MPDLFVSDYMTVQAWLPIISQGQKRFIFDDENNEMLYLLYAMYGILSHNFHHIKNRTNKFEGQKNGGKEKFLLW